MTTPGKPSDNELLSAMLGGDEEALATLYRRRHGGIYRFALQMSGSPALSEDITQEVFMILMREGMTYDPTRGAIGAFLFGVARNLVRQRLGREQFYVSMDDDAEGGNVIDEFAGGVCPLEELSRGETIESVRRAVLSLPPRYREVVVLCELQELSYAEAAAVLDCAIGTVRSRLHRGRAMLIEKMRPEAVENLESPGSVASPLSPASNEQPTARGVKQARCFA
jgi:RNA polymerase sigma-70 factor (ECF subfamily)